MSTFNMQTQPWFIKIPTNRAELVAVSAFIESKVGFCPNTSGHIFLCSYFTNYMQADVMAVSDVVMIGSDIYLKKPNTEIILSFKPTVDGVTYPPKLVVETDTQRQIRELAVVICQASAKLQALKDTQGVK
jgi:hypothetical protein